MGKAIGIDLGTYNSAAAVALGRNRVAMIESKHGRTLYGKHFPSFVLFDHYGKKQLIGQRAREELSINPQLVVWGVKRLIGLSYKTAEETGELDRFAYDIEEGPGGGILIKVGEERYTPSHIFEIILSEIKADAENPKVNPLLGSKVDKAIISIPAYYKATRTAPLIEAAKRAGFDEVDTIAEPTAAAMHYCLDIEEEANLFTFDIGAGTLDVTVMLVVQEEGELVPGELCTSGHESLGGIDMDDALIAHIIDKHQLSHVTEDPALMAILKAEVEKTKIKLSSRLTASLDIPGGETVDIARGELEEVLAPLLEKCRGPIRIALQQAGIGAADLDHVLFVGGPTNMPCIRRVVEDELANSGAQKPLLHTIRTIQTEGMPVDPMECVAKGASLKAGNIIEPVGKVIAEGYGTIYGTSGELPDYYVSIINENTNYPISGSAVICHKNAEDLEIPVPLVAKRPDPEQSTPEQLVYSYEYIGDYTLSITPTGKNPTVDIQLQVTDDKRIVATFVQSQTRQQVRFEGLDMLQGQQILLQEETPPDTWASQEIGLYEDSLNYQQGRWTKKHLEHHLHVAEEALALAHDVEHPKVKAAVESMTRVTEAAVAEDLGNANQHCPNVANRIKELLDILRQPGIDRITSEDFVRYTRQLVEIAKTG